MMKSLDLLASRAVFRARLFEDAVHSTEGWTVQFGSQLAEAERHLTPDGVVFVATFGPEDAEQAFLMHEGEVRSTKHLGAQDESFTLSWVVRAEESQTPALA